MEFAIRPGVSIRRDAHLLANYLENIRLMQMQVVWGQGGALQACISGAAARSLHVYLSCC